MIVRVSNVLIVPGLGSVIGYTKPKHKHRGLVPRWRRGGLQLMPPRLPSMLELFSEVVPIVQRRGLFRTACAGETLTANYQLVRPDIRFG